MGDERVIPVEIAERLIVAVARWEGRVPTEDDALHAGKELAAAAHAVLVWDSEQASQE